MIVVESNSRQFPTPRWTKTDEMVVTVKWPTRNTDMLAARHISFNEGKYPFLCYKYNPPMGERGGKFDHVPRDNIYMTSWKAWDDWYRSFGPVKHKDPSSGTCAVYGVIEAFKPETIGLIGFDFVLDNNTDWLHDAKAELRSIEALVDIVDLRDRKVTVLEVL